MISEDLLMWHVWVGQARGTGPLHAPQLPSDNDKRDTMLDSCMTTLYSIPTEAEDCLRKAQGQLQTSTIGANQSRPSDAAINEKLLERLQALHMKEERSTSEKDGFIVVGGEARM